MDKRPRNIENLSNMELIRMCTAGSVDDGKSTLIARLLFDCNAIFEDQLLALEKSSELKGDEAIELAHLLDGLSAEREQGITIDVAYRYFSTPKRRFIIADVPGHEQYTRNMVTGASNASLAMILVDARKGMLIQSKRHLFIASLLGIPHILIVINKMDLVDFNKDIYEKIKKDFETFTAKMNIQDLQFIPVSAKDGDMVVYRKENMDWYSGRTLIDYLENVNITSDRNLIDFRFPVQYVIRPNQDYRGFAGRIESGIIQKGEKVAILPSGQKSTVETIFYDNYNQDKAHAPQSVVLSLADEVDVSRGDMIVRQNNLPDVTTEFQAMLCWMSEDRMDLNKSYFIKHTSKTTRCKIGEIIYRLNIDSLQREKASSIDVNEIGKVKIKTNDPLMLDSYKTNRATGSFIIIDEATNNTVGAGMVVKTEKSKEKTIQIEKETTKQTIGHPGAVLWFTGLSGSGKSTIADALHAKLCEKYELKIERLDGDIVRESLTKDLGFSAEDRDKNIERVSYVAGLLSKHGVIVLSSFISPYKRHRQLASSHTDNFVEIFVDTPLEVCEKRDVKGLYKKARNGEIPNFTGLDDPYESPVTPHIRVKTHELDLEESVNKVIQYLEENGFLQ
jgi:bifunctional enzyme CysN/CysC